MNGRIVLCWAHARRDFVNLGTGYPNLAPFAKSRHIAALYRLNAQRSPGNAVARRWLAGAVEAFFAKAEKERSEIPEGKPQRAPLDSLLRHRDGLTVFVDNAAVDNNAAERGLRGVGRKLSSQNVDGAGLAGMLHSVFGTLASVSPWLLDYLEACARQRGPPPEDPDAWLPWGTSEQRLRSWDPGTAALTATAAATSPKPPALQRAASIARNCLGKSVGAWRKPDGGLKGARVAMLHMHGPPAAAAARAGCPPMPGPAIERPLVPERLADAQPVAVKPGEGRLWNEFVALGYSTLPGARYFARAQRAARHPRLRRRSLEAAG